jgi:hypothetical protein
MTASLSDILQVKGSPVRSDGEPSAGTPCKALYIWSGDDASPSFWTSTRLIEDIGSEDSLTSNIQPPDLLVAWKYRPLGAIDVISKPQCESRLD